MSKPALRTAGKSVLAIVFSVLILVMAGHHVYRGVALEPIDWLTVGKGVLYALAAVVVLLCRFGFDRWMKWTPEEMAKWRRMAARERFYQQQKVLRAAQAATPSSEEDRRKAGRDFLADVVGKLPGRGEAWTADGVVKLTKEEEESIRRRREEEKQWTPDNPKPQTFDWDDGTCPYERDSSKPLGSKENPLVVGIPRHSTNLVFSPERHCWILTDGLGNGWIR